MRHFEKVTDTRTYTKLVKKTCDLCGFEAKGCTYENANWSSGSFNVDDTTIEVHQKEGSHYPEGGSGTEYNIDLCPKCFKERLVPWLQSQGASIKEEDWDW